MMKTVVKCSVGRRIVVNPNHIFASSSTMPHDSAMQQVKVNKKQSKLEFPEEPTTCCMSGCANCVWLEYAEKLNEYYKDGGEHALKEINEKVVDQNIKTFLLHELRMKQSTN